MAVNYEDPRFAEVKTDETAAVNEVENTYGGMINASDTFFNSQIEASKDWADKQTEIQNQQTDFAIEQINQQKAQSEKDYLKEQKGAYVDWKKQSNKYGANAEAMASQGMTNTGFSESSQVSMYNAYQNRVATAREVFSKATLNYDNAIKDARLQNNAKLAEIAFNALQKQLELSLQGFQYKNSLITEQMNKKMEVDNEYYKRYQDVLNQINTENALAEEVRQFNLQHNENVRQFNKSLEQQQKELNETIRQFNKNYDQKVKEYKEGIRQFNEEIARLKKKDANEYQAQIKELELKKKAMEEEKRQFEESQKLKREQLAEEKRQFDETKASKASNSTTITKTNSSNKTSTPTTPTKPVIKDGGNNTATPTNNKQSIIDLGYGPISATRLAELISTGQVTRTLKNGQYYYSRNTGSFAYNHLKNMGLSK